MELKHESYHQPLTTIRYLSMTKSLCRVISFCSLAPLLVVVAGTAWADTVLTDANLTKLEAALPALAKVEQDNVASLYQVRLQAHCNWSRHATEVRAQQEGQGYLDEVDRILAEHELTAPLFMELTAKGSWPVLDSMRPMLQVSRRALPFLPEPQRQQTVQVLDQTEHMTQAIGPCLTEADKVALQQHRGRLLAMASRMPGGLIPAKAELLP
ncbi:hypothetical protein SAMN04488051_11123 [Alkalimonas amylolytica]|uniref:Uncharacterized protein n=2 Tax=Alkalimonas amylolytica TaxID=152573 RepID=A0A1H4FMI3_ALKAM|nr:hypothetical protein SAMN04488051_11123 [Alkalimonas amylolytica]